jgi:hypothetical protein
MRSSRKKKTKLRGKHQEIKHSDLRVLAQEQDGPQASGQTDAENLVRTLILEMWVPSFRCIPPHLIQRKAPMLKLAHLGPTAQ